MFERWIDAMIQDAMQRGEFENLPGAGKKIDLTTYFETPETVRLAYSVLANAGVVPREVDLLREISELNAAIEAARGDDERLGLRRRIQQLRLELNLRLEGGRR